VDVSGAEAIARKALQQSRERVAALLQDPAPDSRALAWAFGELGNLYQLYNVHTLAEQCYANARALDPDSFRWAYYAAWLALSDGRLQQALERLQQAAHLNPDYPPIQLRLGQAWYDLNRPEKAKQALQRAAQTPGLRAAALYYLGQIDLLERHYPEAAERFREALSLDSEASQLHYPLARAYRAMGDADSARDQLALRGRQMPVVDDPLVRELEALEKGARSLFARGLREVEQSAYQAGAQLFREGLERDSGNLNARLSLSRALYLAGEHAAARAELERVLSKDSEQVLGNFLLGLLQESKGKSDLATERLEKVLQIDPGHAGAHFFLANLLMRKAHFRSAAEHYAAALEGGQDNPPARLMRLVALYRSGEPEAQIMAELQREVAQHPQQQMLQYAAVRMLALSQNEQVRDPSRALELARALAMSFAIPPHLEVLALAQAADGQFEQAINLQEQLISGAAWMGPGPNLERLQRTLDAFRDQRLPAEPWPEDDPMLLPPPIDAQLVFREYPAAVPY
jgi:tetratricopeptide (TPR) repeat protein